MDLEMGEIRGGRDEDARATFRDDADELGDEMAIDNVGKEKSRESEKHRSKDRSKGRREEKDHGSRGRERSKERENDEYIGKDSNRYDVKDRDRSESSRDRKKEERSEYGKDRERDKDRDQNKERSRDRLHEEDHDRDKYREMERDKDRGKDRDREWERSTDRDYDRSRDHGKGRGKEREKDSEIEKERDLMREYERGKERDRDRSKIRERDHEKDVHRESERERERRKEKNHEKGRDKNREKEKDRDRARDTERVKEKIKDREKEKDKDKDRERDRERDKGKEKYREKEIDRISESDRDKSRARDREKGTTGAKEGEKDERTQSDYDDGIVDPRKDEAAQNDDIHEKSGSKNQQKEKPFESTSTSELEERLAKMKEERTNKKSDGASEILSWVNRSRRIDEKKNAEKEALRLSKVFEEQDNILDESEDDEAVGHAQKDLAGVKILHGLDKVIEGGAVVLTLKDQDILKDGDVNDEIDMLENVEIGEQKQRDEAYRAAKKGTGLYDDKFSNDTGSRRGILPQYDDPVDDEGVAFDESGHFTGEAEKKLEELRKRIEGSSVQKSYEDLTSSAKMSSDYYTPEEMLQFKKPKKKKSLRKKEKLNLDAMEAEAISAELGASDLGSRNDMKRQTAKEEKEKIEAEMRSKAYQAAYEKAEEASKVLRQEQTLTLKYMDDEDIVFGEDYEDLQRSLEQARKLAIRKQDETAASGPQAVALLATSSKEQENSQSQPTVDPQEEKVVITEVEEFVLGLQLNEGTQKPESEDVFMDEEDAPKSPEPETKADIGGWTEVEETSETVVPSGKKDDAAPDEIIHEVAVGKGLSSALQLLKERGALKETIDWGGRTMDKKKSKLVGLYDNEGRKEIRIERTDEFGRVMTPKEAFRMLSHKFHGKGPGKMKLEKKMKQYQEDLKTKQMKASDTPLLAVEKMREAQAQLKTPYLVLSGHVKPGQTSDPRSGFATVEKDHMGSLTPMLGDKKVEHFLGIKRKPETGSMGPPPPKKPKS